MAVPTSGGPAARPCPPQAPASRLWDYLPLDPLAPLAEQELDLAAPQQGLGGDPDPQDEKQQVDSGSDPDPQGEPQGEEGEADDGEPQGGDEDGDGGEDEDEGGEGVDAPLPFIPGPRPIPGFSRSPSGDFLREFDSWWNFVETVADDSLYAWKPKRAYNDDDYNISRLPSADYAGQKNWMGSRSFDEARNMALFNGWPEGRRLISDALVQIQTQPKVYAAAEFDVAGAYPCVPLYCAGDPACMFIDPASSLRTSRPIVQIDYDFGIPWMVPIEAAMLRGAAILSLADALEREGISTELRIVTMCRDYGGKNIFRASIVYKKAGEPLDLDRAAFALANPSVQRRFIFGLLEQHEELKCLSGYYAIWLDYRPETKPDEPNPPILIPKATSYETAESARKAVSDAAQALLTQMFEEAAD